MRYGLILAGALLAGLLAMPLAALSATGANAQEYCGFLPHLGAVVQCGYTSRASCENTIGKGAMCFVNPYLALNERRLTPSVLSGERLARG